jgi:hypothetical protein
MKKLCYVLSCLLLLGSCPVLAQGNPPSAIVVRTSEAGNKLYILTARGGEKAERQELKFANYEQVLAKYQQLIASYLDQGYVLQTMTSLNQSYPTTMFVFVKAPQP